MFRSHRRKTVLAAAALMATTAFLTACQGDADAGGKPGDSGSSASASGSGSGSGSKSTSGDSASGTGGARSGTGGKAGGAKTSGKSAAKPAGGTTGKTAGKGVNGTWFGNVSYLAPGKFTVSDLKGTEQAFFTSTSTDIEGAGTICGNAAGQAATPCTEAQLEAAAKKGVSATVKLKNGIAVSVIEDHSSTGGSDKPGSAKASGLHHGPLGYLAPAKFSLLESNGSKITFRTNSSTAINGAGWICGKAGGKTQPCTEAQLEAAARKGTVRVVVQLDSGTAVSIDEEHN